jgi:hypothetical protein
VVTHLPGERHDVAFIRQQRSTREWPFGPLEVKALTQVVKPPGQVAMAQEAAWMRLISRTRISFDHSRPSGQAHRLLRPSVVSR